MITTTETQKIYADHGINLAPAEITEITADANDCEIKDFRNLTAHEWVVRWVKEELRENMDSPLFSERLEYDFSKN
ncbi:hypothetical protein UFOVP259_11 [uncultured Caudovirales phage]|uniref:Uncharacterized protein n=1 Tax=uncultured Caudovirales phage TaxID=2100421 RepID=A0A6J5LE44_9CAUD|nr:hypothetical protein UFOVP259_11 [uncultured Caudovirales phage]